MVGRGVGCLPLRGDPGRGRGGRSGRGAAKPPSGGLTGEAERDLFEALRAKRSELAKANGNAPFMVFPDRTLIELATRRPASAAALATIHGVGQAKRERWGQDVLEVIRRFSGSGVAPEPADMSTRGRPG